MKRLYLSSHDIFELPQQDCMTAGERRELYIDGEFFTIVRAVPNNTQSCESCYLDADSGNHSLKGMCRIPVAYIGESTGHPVPVGVGCCGYSTIIEHIGDVMEEL